MSDAPPRGAGGVHPARRVTHSLGERHFSTGKITVLPFARLCEELELPQLFQSVPRLTISVLCPCQWTWMGIEVVRDASDAVSSPCLWSALAGYAGSRT